MLRRRRAPSRARNERTASTSLIAISRVSELPSSVESEGSATTPAISFATATRASSGVTPLLELASTTTTSGSPAKARVGMNRRSPGQPFRYVLSHDRMPSCRRSAGIRSRSFRNSLREEVVCSPVANAIARSALPQFWNHHLLNGRMGPRREKYRSSGDFNPIAAKDATRRHLSTAYTRTQLERWVVDVRHG